MMAVDTDELRRALALLKGGNRRVVESYLDDLYDTLRWLVECEDDPCRLDHHGYCQEHWKGEIDGECAVAVARRLVGLDAEDGDSNG